MLGITCFGPYKAAENVIFAFGKGGRIAMGSSATTILRGGRGIEVGSFVKLGKEKLPIHAALVEDGFVRARQYYIKIRRAWGSWEGEELSRVEMMVFVDVGDLVL